MPSSQILPLLWIGDEYAARAPEVHAFGYVLNITEEVEKCSVLAEDVLFERFPIIDIGGERQQKKMLGFFTDTSAIIEQGVASGRPVLVHCVEGRQRSCAVVAAYLILSMGLTSLQAKDHIRKNRPEAFKNSRFGVTHVNFESALEQWEETVGSCTSSSAEKMKKTPLCVLGGAEEDPRLSGVKIRLKSPENEKQYCSFYVINCDVSRQNSVPPKLHTYVGCR